MKSKNKCADSIILILKMRHKEGNMERNDMKIDPTRKYYALIVETILIILCSVISNESLVNLFCTKSIDLCSEVVAEIKLNFTTVCPMLWRRGTILIKLEGVTEMSKVNWRYTCIYSLRPKLAPLINVSSSKAISKKWVVNLRHWVQISYNVKNR